MNKPILMAFTTSIGSRELYTGAFTVNPANWIQLLAWRILLRGKAATHYCTQEVIVSEVVIDPNEVVTLIVAEAADQLRRVGYKPTTVYMGPEEFSRAHHQDYPYLRGVPPFGFKAEATMSLPDSKYEPLSFEVKVVPYMRGILVI